MKYLLSALLLIGVIFEIGHCQSHVIDWSVIGSGGGHSQSSNFQVDCTIGQSIVGNSSSSNYQIDAGFWAGTAGGFTCEYILGDINGDGQRIGGDVTYAVRFFKGISMPPPDSCFMDSTGTYLYVAGDLNGNCEFRGSDITRLVSYYKGISQLSYCHFFPPSSLPYFFKQTINPSREQ
jgi:hypothetical protein